MRVNFRKSDSGPGKQSSTAGGAVPGLHRYALAIGEHVDELRALTAEAAHVCTAPVALLGFLDDDRERVRASVGWNVDELPLVSSFAARFANARDVTVVPDASA